MKDDPLHLHGTLLPHGEREDIFVNEGRITFEPVEDARTVVADGYLLPGLVDAHAQLALASPAPQGPPVGDAIRASARTQLESGVLAIREPGGPTRDAREIGVADGLPRIFSGGRFLAAPGGYFQGLARHVPGSELAAAAVEEYRASGHWAKVVGDFFGDDGVIAPT